VISLLPRRADEARRSPRGGGSRRAEAVRARPASDRRRADRGRAPAPAHRMADTPARHRAAVRAACHRCRGAHPRARAHEGARRGAIPRAEVGVQILSTFDDRRAMDETSRPAWLPLGSLLVRERLITPEQLELVLLEQEQDRSRRLGEILVEWGWVSSRAIAEALSEQYGIRFLDLDGMEIDERAAALLDEDVAEGYEALPVRFLPDGVVLVA